jgi:signal transduction histidine kinase
MNSELRDPLDLAGIPPLPERTVAIGPPGWRAGRSVTDRLVPVVERLESLPADSVRPAAASDSPMPPLALIHGGRWLATEREGALEALLSELAALLPDHLPVIVGGRATTERAIELARRGLFDWLERPEVVTSWRRLFAAAGVEGKRRTARGPLQANARGVRRALEVHQRRLRRETDALASELLRTQASLDEVNRELSRHMGQLALLYRFGRELSAARNWDETLESLLGSLTRFVGAAGAALILRSAPGGAYAARRTYRWDEASWDKIVLSLQGQLESEVAEGMLAPGVFRVSASGATSRESERRMIALPLEHQGVRLGYLLLLGPAAVEAAFAERFLPFLQTVQVVLSEEVAAAQILDRMRSIGSFNARVLETVSSGIWVLDAVGRTIYCNRAGRELLTGRPAPADPAVDVVFRIGRGRLQQDSSDASAGDGTVELLYESRLRMDGPAEAVRDRLCGGGEPYRGEGTLVRDDGETVPVLVQTAPMPGRPSGERWTVVVVEDLREARKLEAERLRADRLESLVELSAGLAHEIRNPLMGLSAQAELLAEQLPADDPRRRYTELITTEVGRIDGTITRLLSFVKPYEPRLAPVELPALVAECIELVRSRADAQTVALAAAFDELVVHERCAVDAAQIKQVVLNLLINAIDAAPAGGRVEARVIPWSSLEVRDPVRGTSHAYPGIAIEVSDDGPGVPAEIRDKIFRPFYTTKSSGTGLGLAITQKIVNAHGGTIAVDRAAERTVFRILLIRGAAPAGQQRRQEAS